jgi:crotonobetainyl-CoA:carnitine CoA-transferase CaiB-like acyl-CoA transferase
LSDSSFGHANASHAPAPLLGEHTRDVLQAEGYDDAEIDAFVAAGVVATS